MENMISKLEKKVEDLEGMKSGTNVKGLANGEVRKNDEEVEKLSKIIKENRDTITESGQEIVEIRKEIVAVETIHTASCYVILYIIRIIKLSKYLIVNHKYHWY